MLPRAPQGARKVPSVPLRSPGPPEESGHLLCSRSATGAHRCPSLPVINNLLLPAPCPQVEGLRDRSRRCSRSGRDTGQTCVWSARPSAASYRSWLRRLSKAVPDHLGRVFLTPALLPRAPQPHPAPMPARHLSGSSPAGHGHSAVRPPAQWAWAPCPASSEPLCRLPGLQPGHHHLFQAQTNPRPFLLPQA